MKLIVIILSKVVYGGESVGRDIRIKTSISGIHAVLDKRIHVGSAISLSHSIAAIESDWEKLYEILIRARTGDGKSIGTLHVVD